MKKFKTYYKSVFIKKIYFKTYPIQQVQLKISFNESLCLLQKSIGYFRIFKNINFHILDCLYY